MGLYVWAHGNDGPLTRVASNGSHVMVTGYLFAAYVAARGSEANRVCAWVAPWLSRSQPWHPDAPRPERNRPATVDALLAFSTDEDGDGVAESGYCVAQDETIALGTKMRPVGDPMLADLVALWQALRDGGGMTQLDIGLTARLAGHMALLEEQWRVSESWHEAMDDIAEVFTWAAAHGVPVHFG